MISMGNIWDRTAAFISDNIDILLPIILGAVFVPAIIASNLADLLPGSNAMTALWLQISGFVMILIGFWGQLAITALALNPESGRGSYGVAARAFPRAALLVLTLVVASMLAVIPLGVIFAMGGVDLSGLQSGTMPNIPVQISLWVSLYMLVALGVMLWLATRLAVVMPVVVEEGRGVAAIGRSWRLTSGVALKIFGVILLYAVVSNVAALATITVVGSVMKLIAGGGGALSLASVMTTIAGAAVSTSFTVLGTAFIAKLYIALLARSEAVAVS